MAKTSPADLKSEGAELKIILAKIKKKQHNCAMLMAKDGIILEVHLKKSPEVLLKAAKKAGGTAKGVWGTITMDGQVLIIDPINDKIPGNLTKVAKKFFAERGLKNRLEIKEPEEGAAPVADTPSENASAGAEVPSESHDERPDQRKALMERVKALQPRIDALLADTKSLMVDGLKDTMGLFTRAMQDELFDRADEALGKVTSVLDDYDGLMAQKRPFLDRMSALSRDIEKVVNGPDEDAATTIARYKREFEYAVENNEWFSSGEKLDQIEALIGNTENADDDHNAPEAEQADEAANTEAPETSGDDKTRLVQAFKALTPQIKSALKSDDKSIVKNVGTLAKGFAKALKAGDLAKSQKIMDLLMSMVGASTTDSTPTAENAGTNSPAKDNRLKTLRSMRRSLDTMLQEMGHA